MNVMRDEIQVLCFNDTWSLVLFHPLMNVIGSCWVYRIKHHVDSNIERYMTRSVAKGSTRQQGIDYSKTSNPVIKQVTVRLVFFIVVLHGWKIHQLDIHNAPQ
jgi:hypothetical protein